MRTTILALILVAACDQPAKPETKAEPAKPEDLARAANDAVLVHQLAEQYQLQKRKCPKDMAEMQAAGFASSGTDPWGKPFVIYCEDGGGIIVFSVGPDGVQGTNDDISSDK